MDSDTYILCKMILLWYSNNKDEPAPDFVMKAIEMLGDALINIPDEDLEDL